VERSRTIFSPISEEVIDVRSEATLVAQADEQVEHGGAETRHPDRGVTVADVELDAMRVLWQWIGYLMGIPDELLPTGVDKPRQLNVAALGVQPRLIPDDSRIRHEDEKTRPPF
jgi:hypothetical protein